MKQKDLAQILDGILGSGGKFPPLLVFGGPGVGKSSICRQAAERHGYRLYDIRALLRDPIDFVGIPVPFAVLADGRRAPIMMLVGREAEVTDYFVQWLAPSFLPPQNSEEKALVLLDELLLAPTMTTNALLQLVLDRQLGEYKLPDTAYIVALSNRPDEAVGVHKLSPPLRRRFVVLTLEPNIDDWLEWAVTAGIHPAVVGFLKKRPELLYKFSPTDAFPNPASWEFVSKVLLLTSTYNFELVTGCVGEGAATEFMAFFNISARLPDIKDVLYGRVDFAPDDVDTAYALCSGLAYVVETQDEFDLALAYTKRLLPEFMIFLLKMLFTKSRVKCVKSKHWSEISVHLTEEGVI